MIRRPAVAGAFYPATRREIEAMIKSFVEEGVDKVKALGLIAPHAGYIYSGKGAGIAYSRVEIPKNVIVLCPNHRGAGEDVAIMSEGHWEMPTGKVPLNTTLAELIKERSSLVKEDHRAHAQEHSLEVQVPFLQHFQPDFQLVPISLSRVSLEECRELGQAIAQAIADYGQEVLVVASSDMTHFESAQSAKKKDDLALARILALDPEGLYETVMRSRISMCGVIPVTIMLFSAKARGAKKAELLDYRNSGDVTGDYHDVVAYAAVRVY